MKQINDLHLQKGIQTDDVESTILQRNQRVSVNGIPFFLMGDVKAATGKGHVALAFKPQPECGELDIPKPLPRGGSLMLTQ